MEVFDTSVKICKKRWNKFLFQQTDNRTEISNWTVNWNVKTRDSKNVIFFKINNICKFALTIGFNFRWINRILVSARNADRRGRGGCKKGVQSRTLPGIFFKNLINKNARKHKKSVTHWVNLTALKHLLQIWQKHRGPYPQVVEPVYIYDDSKQNI